MLWILIKNDGNYEQEEDDEVEDEDNGMIINEDETSEAFESQFKNARYLIMYCTNFMILTYSRVDVLQRFTYQTLIGVLERIFEDAPGSVGFFWQIPLFFFVIFEHVLSHDCVIRQNVVDCTKKLHEMIIRIMSEFFAAAQKKSFNFFFSSIKWDNDIYLKILLQKLIKFHVFCWCKSNCSFCIVKISYLIL